MRGRSVIRFRPVVRVIWCGQCRWLHSSLRVSPRRGAGATREFPCAWTTARFLTANWAPVELWPPCSTLIFSVIGQTSRLVESVLRIFGRDPGQLGQDWSPTRQAVLAYLRALADWLNTDQWPSDLRFGGPELRAAEFERKLRIAATNEARARDQDADTVADRSRRLVVLGEPGSGKTWFARKTAHRCALRSLAELESGTGLASVELPLYATCSDLFAAKGDIRLAVVSSALDQLPDLGSSHAISRLRAFFTERDAPTLLVLDSLDEARGPADRLRQAGSLPWRIVPTSRPSSWNRHLTVDEARWSVCLRRCGIPTMSTHLSAAGSAAGTPAEMTWCARSHSARRFSNWLPFPFFLPFAASSEAQSRCRTSGTSSTSRF